MAKCQFNNVKISGIVTVVPPDVKCIDDEVELYGGNKKQINRIKKAIGLDKRHVVDTETTSLDLCAEAAIHLLNSTKSNCKEIDGLIMVTQTPDHFQPSNAAILHGILGLEKDCASYDVNLGCSGYVYGLWLAHMMIESRTCKNVILLAGDTISKNVNPRDRTVAPLFGDAGSATLIQRATNSNSTYFSLHTDGTGHEFIKVPAGGFRKPTTPETRKDILQEDDNYRSENDLVMNGAEVFNFSIKVEPEAIHEIINYANKTIEEIDYIIFHQANQYIISNIIRRLKCPKEKAPSNTVNKYGNQSSASIPATINDAIRNEVSANSKSIIMSGFGVGLSWASCLTTLDNIYCPEVLIYNGDKIK
ncbi:3-ketoacyl-ACP synthase [Candidatus Thiomargarita nelsonii]|uniref:3-ketoacyl-ACP synthase n=1 Tax=Candidatus Thiomargarita nelsonii TaxID=1003181 RepID=A0A0A6P7U6_9GAMM|nr:3-ketoacyl-ACP synthase [Candidatus Thiomargarita nelsonii]